MALSIDTPAPQELMERFREQGFEQLWFVSLE
jgi:hypothetical protein